MYYKLWKKCTWILWTCNFFWKWYTCWPCPQLSLGKASWGWEGGGLFWLAGNLIKRNVLRWCPVIRLSFTQESLFLMWKHLATCHMSKNLIFNVWHIFEAVPVVNTHKHNRSIFVPLLQHNGNSNISAKSLWSSHQVKSHAWSFFYFILILFQKSQLKQLEAHLSSYFAQHFNIQGRRSSSRSSSEYGMWLILERLYILME